ncbi:MAG: PEP-CTERM system histidine kinase PrsK [Candidatus Accumulibacter sp.]|uniref:histidine kinase n=3 Tax=Candidatus Accumulibacter TaxID=327159 RepID=A0A7D5SBR0_9PROT|nr:PEP-CTERM system histidine kinase PrsK [Accumulibacter sp.]MBN8517328.1 PEP-CTERM system histidine kinase PrsK [Accumulibacter sp.]MBO3710872.1 PEP-CTERM system histidine kinase PrsK [Accumulibacter sp.]QLH51160.1 MAG: PEP-CTERM system histidine kinase PrsK [Candidatus Accumulibacter cognatus]TMQ77086.1 Sensory transduction histidine kinase [Candidatus Accumulibacter phosphatis]
MDSKMAMVTAWSYGLAAVLAAFLTLYLASGWRAGGRSRAMFLAVSLCALWGGLSLAFVMTGNVVFLAGSLLADVLRFGGWYFFLLVLMKPEPTDAEIASARFGWLSGFSWLLVVIALASQLLLVFGIDLVVPSQRVVLFVSLAMTVFGLVLVERLFRNVSPDFRWSIKPLCLGLGGVFLFDLYLYSDALLFNRVDSDAFSIRGFAHAMGLPLVALSAIRSHDWKRRLVMSQRAALQSVTLLIVGIYLLFMAAAGYYVRFFGGEWGRALQLALLFAALLVLVGLTFSGSMRARLRVQVGKHFFSYRYDYREEWLRFTQTLSLQGGFSGMGQHVVRGLADMVESPSGALWLKDPSGRFFAQAAYWNMPASSATEDVGSPLCRFLLDSGWVINLEEYRSLPRRYDGLQIPSWLVEVPNAWLVVPLTTGNELIAFVVLATARTKIDVNWEVNDLLKTAARQAGAFLGQMQASEALLEVRKFDSFNRMSAFVVHDLKNIITQLSLMLKNAERHRDNPEFQKDMLMTVEHSVERMRKLMMQLREGATPLDGPRGIDLAGVLRRIQTAKSGQGRDIELKIEEKLVARGHEDRIERVIGHLVQNALDATEDRGRVWVRLTRQGTQALVEVGDSGHGMSPEFVRERLFKPFQTTKPTGMGIGAYESFQYIHELGGKMTVDSAVDVGTQVDLLLPLFDVGHTTASADLLKESE